MGLIKKLFGMETVLDKINQARENRSDTLNLSMCQLAELPPEVGSLRHLTTLDLSNNLLSYLPMEIGNLSRLTILRCNGNQLASVPQEIGKLTQLAEMDLSDNKLNALPNDIGKLIHLRHLGIKNNRILQLPLEMRKCTVLESIIMDDSLAYDIPGLFKRTDGMVEYYNGGDVVSHLQRKKEQEDREKREAVFSWLNSLDVRTRKQVSDTGVQKLVVLREAREAEERVGNQRLNSEIDEHMRDVNTRIAQMQGDVATLEDSAALIRRTLKKSGLAQLEEKISNMTKLMDNFNLEKQALLEKREEIDTEIKAKLREYDDAALETVALDMQNDIEGIEAVNVAPLSNAPRSGTSKADKLYYDAKRAFIGLEVAPGYTAKELIGASRHVVYLCEKDGGEFAVKQPRMTMETLDLNVFKEFEREIETWKGLDHPNIVKLVEYGMQPYPWIAMEYLRGKSLKERMAEFDELDRRRATVEMLDAVAYAHSKGIIHCDIKPDNLMFDEDKNLKVTDWGLSKVLDKEKTERASEVGGFTMLYAPLEQYGGIYGKRNDVFSMGVVLYEMYAGELPFKTLEELSQNSADPSPLEEKGIPDGLKWVIIKAIAKRKEERWTDAEEMCRAAKAAMT